MTNCVGHSIISIFYLYTHGVSELLNTKNMSAIQSSQHTLRGQTSWLPVLFNLKAKKMASSSGGTRLHVARNSCSRPICRSTVQKKEADSVGGSFSCFIRLLSCLVSASLASHQNPSCQIYTWASAFSNKLAPPFSAKKQKTSARLSSPPRRSSRHPTRRYLRRRRRPRPPFPSLLPSPPALRRAGRVRLRPRHRAVPAASAPSTRNPRCLFPAAAGCGVPPLPLFLSLSLSLLGCQRCSRPRPRQLPCVARVHGP